MVVPVPVPVRVLLGVPLALAPSDGVAEGVTLALGAPQRRALALQATPAAQRGVSAMRVQAGPSARGAGHTACALPQLAP